MTFSPYELSQHGLFGSGIGYGPFPERLRAGKTPTPASQPIRLRWNTDTAATGDQSDGLEHTSAFDRDQRNERHDRYRAGQSGSDAEPDTGTGGADNSSDTRSFLRHPRSGKTRLRDESARAQCGICRRARISSRHGSQRSLHRSYFSCSLSTPVFRREILRPRCHSLRA